MKDFYDLWILAHRFYFDGPVLSRAIEQTFVRLDSAFPEQTPTGLSPGFFSDKQKNLQWNAFVRKGALLSSATSPSLEETCESSLLQVSGRRFLEPI